MKRHVGFSVLLGLALLGAPPVEAGRPRNWDWREWKCVSSVKKQRDCGSCWAHAACASAESAMLIEDAVELDISEQWLLDCTFNDGKNCDGSYEILAFPYMDGLLKDECNQTGMVLEEDKPYQGEEGNCNCPHPRIESLESWSLVVPWDDETVKNVIYETGPVSRAFLHTANIKNYDGGVLQDCGGEWETAHAILIVGYNDDGGYWIIKNSKGTGWGEDGYMRMAYDCADLWWYPDVYTVSAHKEHRGEWVDFAFGYFGGGRFHYPYNLLSSAVSAVDAGGTIKIKAGRTPQGITIRKNVRLEAVHGQVTIGR